MPAKKTSPDAPGTNCSGGVRSPFNAPFQKLNKGSQDTMKAPFNAPKAGGGGELPTKLYDDLGGRAPKGPGFAAQGPSALGPSRPGTKQFSK